MISVDALTHGFTSGTVPATIGITHACAGLTRILFAALYLTGDKPAATMTYNGVAMNKIRQDNQGTCETQLWYMVAPPIGSFTVQAGGVSGVVKALSAISFNGVSQATPITNNNGANNNGTLAQANNVIPNANQYLLGILATLALSPTIGGGGQVSEFIDDFGTIRAAMSLLGPVGVGTSASSWSLNETNDYAVSNIGINPDASPPPSSSGGTDKVFPSSPGSLATMDVAFPCG